MASSKSIVQCTSSSSSSHVMSTYDVFVSFRGEDTRNNFTSFLRHALSKHAIHVFKDDEDLKKGESIAPELLQAIQGSLLFVVVFSKNYASSTWCLRELVEICNSIETSSRQVLPIFYDVDPSEVRKQSGYYGMAFAEHEQRFREDREKMEEVQRWRQVLTQVANLSGWDIRNKPQHVIIEEIVEKIRKILDPKYSSLPNDNLVGMDHRVQELQKLLQLGSDDNVRIVGISGMSGIGKTTLARALCERISHHYDSCCFIDNVSEIFQKAGAFGVQKELLCQSLNEKNLQICNVMEGTLLASTRLCNAKRLIVFDNVTEDEQLNMFSGNRETLLRESLGGGSRVIIISRDGHILRTQTVDDVYKVEPLNDEDAIQLFCKKAFKCNYIVSDYEDLTHGILSHLEGHPLAIEVIGSSLFSKNISQWGSTLDKLRKKGSENIMHKLRIGFDELDATNKELFLDIACVPEYYNFEFVKEILDIRGFYPDSGLPILVDKSLITVTDEKISMPKLLRDLGKYIVREKSPEEPRKWSRLWDYKDLHKVLSQNMEETNVEAIFIGEEFDGTTMPMTVNALSKLRNLKLLLLLSNFKSSESLNDLSNELGYIRWINYPCHCLPQSFQPHKLVKLELYGSNIKQLWEDTKPLHNLKILNLSYSEKLVKLHNFGEAINLKSLQLEGCIKLKQIDLTSGFPKTLTTLNLKDCRSLTNLPHFRDALNLARLNLEGCTKLRQIDQSIGLLKKLIYLNLKDCKSLVSLPNNILELNSLECLSLFGCPHLYKNQLLKEPRDAEHSKKLCILEAPSHSQSSSSIVTRCFTWLLNPFFREQKDPLNLLLPSMCTLSCMRKLDLSFCNLLQVPDAIGNLHSLESLSLMGNNFAVLPNLKELYKLIHLNLQHCKRLEYLPQLPSQTDVPSSVSKYWAEDNEKELGLNIFNCPEVGISERCSSMCFAWIMQIVKGHHQSNISFRLTQYPEFSNIIGGSEIPRWFNSEHVCTDNSIRIHASHVRGKKDYLGIACCAIFAARIKRKMDPPITEPADFTDRIPLFYRADLVTDESDHLWLFYIPEYYFVFYYNKITDELKTKIGGGEGYDVEVKKYGYRLVYEKDLQSSNLTIMHTQTSLPRKRKRFTEIEE